VPVDAPTSFAALIVENWVVTPGASLIRRAAFDEIAGFAPATVPADDWDLNIRLARLGDLPLVDRVVLNWRRHPAAQSNASPRYRPATLLVRHRAARAAANTPQQRALATDLLLAEGRRLRRDAVDAARAGDARRAVLDLTFAGLYHASHVHHRVLERYRRVRLLLRGGQLG
jgi:hypothetical protein